MASKFFKQWDSLYSKEWFCLNEPPIAIFWHILLPFLPHSCLYTKWMSIILMGKFRLMAGKLWSQQLNIHLSLQRICFFAISWNELYIKFVLHQDFIHLNYVILYLFISAHLLFLTPTSHIASTVSHIFACQKEHIDLAIMVPLVVNIILPTAKVGVLTEEETGRV